MAGTSELEVVDTGRDSGEEGMEETRAVQIVVRQRDGEIIVIDNNVSHRNAVDKILDALVAPRETIISQFIFLGS